ILEAAYSLATEGRSVRVVSMPSWSLFAEQTQAYRDQVLPPSADLRIAVEAGVTQGWERWVGPKGRIMGINHFGASAPYKTIYEHFGLTVKDILDQAHRMLGMVD
ncbi:MAG: transketolase C-terminal domain-containing protein, partial [Anaerolineaceae bacterium]